MFMQHTIYTVQHGAKYSFLISPVHDLFNKCITSQNQNGGKMRQNTSSVGTGSQYSDSSRSMIRAAIIKDEGLERHGSVRTLSNANIATPHRQPIARIDSQGLN